MKRFVPLCSLSLLSLAASLALSGCASSMSFPDSPAPLDQNDLGTINGSVFGGHAPLVGAHVYVIQPGQSGYGSQASTLLSATYTGSYPTTRNSGSTDGNVPTSWYYVTTDSKGGFNITGDYSCSVGLPVFLYAFGGTPTLPSTGTPAAHTYTVNNIVVTDGPGGPFSSTKTLTWTTTAQNLAYTGEVLTGSGFTANGNLNGTQIVIDTPAYNKFVTLTNIPFVANGSYNLSGTITANPQPNPDAVNMATLGVCPASGNFSTGPSAISYVYMNEVSTAATAYAFQGFTSASFNDAFHIGSGATAQGKIGLQNAALTAANLYDIQGSTNSTTYQGEGHIARYVTPAGNGIVPTRLINTLGNILAACVDSNSTNANGASPACNVLLSTTSSTGGTGGNNPPDTATAAFYIARYPAGNGSTSYVSNLYGLPSSTVPFSPALTTQPDDFTMYVQYPVTGNAADGTAVSNPFLGRAESVTIDSKGNVWGTAQTGNYAFELSNTGAKLCTFSTSYYFGYLALDINDKPWAGNANTTSGITKFSPATSGSTCGTALYNANTYHQAYTVVNDGSGNTYFMAQNSTGSGPFNIYEFPIGAATSSAASFISQPFSAGATIAHASIDNSTGNFWITNENGAGGASTYGKVVASTGIPLFTLTAAGGQPEVPAIDSANNAWIPLQNTTGQVLKVGSSGGVPTVITNTSSHAKFSSSFGAAVDGNGNIWISNRGSIAPFYNAGTPGGNSIVELNGSTNVAISPTAGNYTLGGILNDPLNLAIDPSGNMWISNYGGDKLVEMIGTAAPVVTPISVASFNGALGTKP